MSISQHTVETEQLSLFEYKLSTAKNISLRFILRKHIHMGVWLTSPWREIFPPIREINTFHYNVTEVGS